MATSLHNLSEYNIESVPCGKNYKIAVIVSEWNPEITGALLLGAKEALETHGVAPENISIKTVPGSFELVFAAKCAAYSQHEYDAVIVLGCVIQGDTPHFDYVCSGVTQGVTQINSDPSCFAPVIFGLLTTNTLEQAQDRAGGKHGNKGVEAAITALKMIKNICTE